MRSDYFRYNLKMRILAPVTVIMVIAVLVLAVSLIAMQQRLLGGMQAQLAEVIRGSSQDIQANMDHTSQEMQQVLEKAARAWAGPVSEYPR